MNEKIHVLIADDHPLFREGLANVLSMEPDFEVVGQAENMQEAITQTGNLLPDLVVLDIDMPGGGLNAARAISKASPVTKILILTASDDDDNLMEALKTGVKAYILKGVAARELIRILRAVKEGETYVPPALAASLLLEMSETDGHSKKPVNPIDELSSREREILERLASGLSNKEIGLQLFISEKTVKHYMTNILQKLQVRNRVEAALLAQKRNQAENSG